MKTIGLGSTREAGNLLGVSGVRVRQLCQAGRVVGAVLVGNTWAVPLPPHVLPPEPSHRRRGAIEQAFGPPEFLAKRLPKATA